MVIFWQAPKILQFLQSNSSKKCLRYRQDLRILDPDPFCILLMHFVCGLLQLIYPIISCLAIYEKSLVVKHIYQVVDHVEEKKNIYADWLSTFYTYECIIKNVHDAFPS